ncbi:response regulator [Synechococcus bigranulatus str. 'Rupite']|uniref:Response regulator n=2 Tax=Thermostichus vulcanus TaxID=32053 RepID=A0ABT0CEM4_THEVL|nr:response regulator [Thermostichus vulcanus str. 'Rupite']
MDPSPESIVVPQSETPQTGSSFGKADDGSIRAHVLIVDDSYMVAEMLSNFLGKQGCSISYALDGSSALEQIRRRPPDLIIADWVMPSLNGLDLCRQLRQSPEYAWVYYIIMTAREGNDNMERALEAGADEFLSKPFQAAELMTRVRAGLRIVESRRQQHLIKTGQKQVPSPAKSIGLEVGNRQDLVTRLPLRVAQARSQSEPLSLFVLRIANLSALSKGLDAQARAALLKLFTDRLANNLREGDDLFCYDEGQFIVLLSGSTLAATQIAAERCCQRMIQDPFVVNGQALPVQLHFGAASLMENDDPKGVALLRRAAQAMRDSKNLHSSVVTAPSPISAPEELLNRLKELETENENLRQDLETRIAQIQDLQTQNLQLKEKIHQEKIQVTSLEHLPPSQGFLTHERPQLISRKPIQRRLKRKPRRRSLYRSIYRRKLHRT